jgi:hypothetical protein
MQGQICSS